MGDSGGRTHAVTAALRARSNDLTANFGRRLREAVPEYHDVDASDFVAAGWAALAVVVHGALTALDDPTTPQDLPAELAAESAAAARHGMPWVVVGRSYHLTHRVLWEAALVEVAAMGLRRDAERELLQTLSSGLFDYFDTVTRQAGDAYEQARTRLRDGGRDPRVLHLVGQVLRGTRVRDEDLGYRLGQQHLAVVAWGSDPHDDLVALARRHDTEVLVVNPRGDQWWAWFGSARTDPATLVALLSPRPDQVLALGEPQTGVVGFQVSHHQAELAASVAARNLVTTQRGLVRYADVATEAVALDDESSARVFVRHQLHDLLGPTRRDEDLRATLLAYATAGLNAHTAARALGIAERTLRYRLTHLENVLGTDFRGRMPELVVAVRLHAALLQQRTKRRPGGDG